MNKLFSKAYTLRFIVDPNVITPEHLTKEVDAYCKQKKINIKEWEITDCIDRIPGSCTIIRTSFITIIGSKKDFKFLKNFLSEFQNSRALFILTV